MKASRATMRPSPSLNLKEVKGTEKSPEEMMRSLGLKAPIHEANGNAVVLPYESGMAHLSDLLAQLDQRMRLFLFRRRGLFSEFDPFRISEKEIEILLLERSLPQNAQRTIVSEEERALMDAMIQFEAHIARRAQAPEGIFLPMVALSNRFNLTPLECDVNTSDCLDISIMT